MKFFLTWLLSIVLASMSFGQVLFGNDTNAFVLMPAQTIASAFTSDLKISPSGRLVLYRQVPIGPPESIFEKPNNSKGKWLIYDRVSKISKSFDLPSELTNVDFLADDQTIFFDTFPTNSMKGFLNLSSGQITLINTLDARLIYLGSQSYANFLLGVSKDETLIAFYPDGKVRTAKLEPKMKIFWPIAGNSASITFMARPADKSGRQYKAILNRANFALTYSEFAEGELDKLLYFDIPQVIEFNRRTSGDTDFISIEDDADIPSTRVVVSKRPTEDRKKPSFVAKSANLGPSGGEVEFSSKMDFVVYQDSGALLLREIKPINRSVAEKLALEEAKKKLLSKAKQVGLGFLIYAADCDDILPGPEGWEVKIFPYVKSRDLMNDFNYTFRGGDVNLVKDPSSTELGFVVGPGGRAVVYLDGSAKWIQDP